MNVLFVCKWNCFRSKTAEAVFRKWNTNYSNHVQSAGLFPGHITQDIIEVGSHLGLDLAVQPRGLSHDVAKWADYIIVVADDVPTHIFDVFVEEDNVTLLHWAFKDIHGFSLERREEVMRDIELGVKSFLAEHNALDVNE